MNDLLLKKNVFHLMSVLQMRPFPKLILSHKIRESSNLAITFKVISFPNKLLSKQFSKFLLVISGKAFS